MKAAVIRKHGEADVLEYLEWPDPKPGQGPPRTRRSTAPSTAPWSRRSTSGKLFSHAAGLDVAPGRKLAEKQGGTATGSSHSA